MTAAPSAAAPRLFHSKSPVTSRVLRILVTSQRGCQRKKNPAILRLDMCGLQRRRASLRDRRGGRREQRALDDEQRELVEMLDSSARLLMQLLNDVLDLSKIESGHMELEASPFDPASPVDDVVTVFAAVAREKGIALRTSVPPRRANAVGDLTRVRQVLWNLAGNALRFKSTGEVVVSLVIHPRAAAAASSSIAYAIPAGACSVAR